MILAWDHPFLNDLFFFLPIALALRSARAIFGSFLPFLLRFLWEMSLDPSDSRSEDWSRRRSAYSSVVSVTVPIHSPKSVREIG